CIFGFCGYKINHTYASPGTYTASLNWDDGKCTGNCTFDVGGMAKITITVTGNSVQKSFVSASPDAGTAPLKVIFTGNGGVGCNVGHFTLDYGDSSQEFDTSADTCGAFTLDNTYQRPGVYHVRLYAGEFQKDTIHILGTANITVS